MLMEIKEKNIIANNPEKVANVLQAVLKGENKIDQDKEHFWAVGLNARNKIVYIDLVSLGILNTNLVHPRETFRLAISRGVESIIVAHNHPSGGIEPSERDSAITSRLKKAGEIIGIKVIDHLIITEDSYYSFKSEGTF